MDPFWTRTRFLQAAALAVIAVGLYGSNFNHEFHLDSTYGLLQNEAIRSLSQIPSYFVDPFTLTSLRSNADYRPVLQITYALNYWVSDYSMWSWHLLQVALHVFNAICLMGILAILLPRMLVDPPEHARTWLPFLAAVIFLVHPTASGVVNYLWARSSLLTAAFLLPAIWCVIRDRWRWAAALYTLALFTKVEAVGCLGVFAMWCVLRRAETRLAEEPESRGGLLGDLSVLLTRASLTRLGPMLAVTCVYGALRVWLLPDFLAEVRSDEDTTALAYFSTQLTVWWHYVSQWWVPIGLVGDNLTYPRFETLLEPLVLLAAAGWAATALGFAAIYRSRPIYTFLGVSALATISPHSSILPLAEMVNEHRPYLPIALLSACWVIPAGYAIMGRDWSYAGRRALCSVGLVAVVAALSVGTVERNASFATWGTYWSDVVEKAPSWRSHLNLGWWHARENQPEEAEAHFLQAIAYAPHNFYAPANLALLYSKQGRHALALENHTRAVSLDHHTSIALEGRADYLMSQDKYAEAIADLELATARTMRPFDVSFKMAQAAASIDDWRACLKATLRARDLDETRTAKDIVDVISPFWDSDVRARTGLKYFEALATSWPKQWWIHANWGDLAAKLGMTELAAHQRAVSVSYRGKP
jgi:protein O-mannosyl-transferase